MSEPKHNRQENHVERMSSQVGGDGKIRVQTRTAQSILQDRKIGRLPAHQRYEILAKSIAPRRKSFLV